MGTGNEWLALGLVFGVLFTWLGILIALFSLPMARGEVHSCEYNYRPWQPKFVKAMSDEELDRVNQKGAKWMLVFSMFMVVLGLCAIIFGVMSIMNPIILALLAIIVLTTIIIAGSVYTFAFWRKTHKAK